MRKNRLKVLSMLMCVLMSFVALVSGVGCGGGGGEKVDNSKSQLYVGIYGGGYGTAYMEDLKVRFEEYAKEMEFEPGRKGVQIFYQEDKDKYKAGTLVDTISYDTNDMFHVTGDELEKFLAGDKILEITDVVTTLLTEFGETRSIADKLGAEMVAHHNVDGKYYTMPFAESSLGIIYDVDVFEENQLYIAKNGAPSEAKQQGGSYSGYKWVGATGERSAGPDGKYETEYDNGFPATLEEFEELIERMKKSNVDSIIWTGQYADTYTSFVPQAFHVNYHGLEEAKILYDGGGANGRETSLITGWNGTEPIITKVNVKMNNIEDLAKQAGYYYGLKMYEIMLKSDTVSKDAFVDLSHVRTQETFLASTFEADRPIAMMIDGTWWESEAESSGAFADLVDTYGDVASRTSRRFGFFPMPKATLAQVGQKNTIRGGGGTILIKNNISEEKANLAKTFLRFSLTDESLRRFTLNTSLPTPFKYEMLESDFNSMSFFAKNFWETYRNSDIFYEYKAKDLVENDRYDHVLDTIKYQTSQGYALFPDAIKFPEPGKDPVTAEIYFKGIYEEAKATIG